MRRSLAALGIGVLLAASATACGDPSNASDSDAADAEVASLGTSTEDTSTTDTSTADTVPAIEDVTDDITDATTDDTTDEATSDEPQGMEDALLEYAQCMRDHGVDYPDPDVSGGGPINVQLGGDPNDPAMRDADEACHSIMDEATSSFAPLDPEEAARMQEQMLDFAQCMRDHGIDFPDPELSDNGMVTVHAEAGDAATPMDDPKFEEAQEACGEYMPKLTAGGK